MSAADDVPDAQPQQPPDPDVPSTDEPAKIDAQAPLNVLYCEGTILRSSVTSANRPTQSSVHATARVLRIWVQLNEMQRMATGCTPGAV